jgi:hypothetical protein
MVSDDFAAIFPPAKGIAKETRIGRRWFLKEILELKLKNQPASSFLHREARMTLPYYPIYFAFWIRVFPFRARFKRD